MTDHGPVPPGILVAGAGAAGVSAALWLRGLGLPFRWIGPEAAVGGTLRRVGNPIANYPGCRVADGPALVEKLLGDLDAEGLRPEDGSIVELRGSPDAPPEVRLDGGRVLRPGHLLLCTGTRPRLLGIEHESELLGDRVEISVTRTLERHAGKRVVVAGGGDAALEGALLLAARCPEVHVVHRRDAFRGQARFVDAVRSSARIHLHMENEVVALDPFPGGLSVQLRRGEAIRAGALFVRIGVAPCVPAGIPPGCLDTDGYLRTSLDGHTGWAGVLAAGDVTGRQHQSVAWAVGSAARAAESIARDGGWKALSLRGDAAGDAG